MSKRIAVVTGGAGFIGSHMVDLLLARGYRVRVIDNLVGGREATSLSTATTPRSGVRMARYPRPRTWRTIVQECRVTSSILPASATSSPRSSSRSITWTSMSRARCACSNARARPVCKKFVYAASSSCYGLADSADRAKTIRSRRSILTRLSKYHGEEAALHWHRSTACRSIRSAFSTPMGPRVRTTGAYGAVFGVFFKQKLAGKPFTVDRRRHPAPRLSLRDRRRSGFLAAAETDTTGEIWNLGAGNPQSREPTGRIARRAGGLHSEAAGRARLHLGRYRQDPARPRLEAAWCPSTRASAA